MTPTLTRRSLLGGIAAAGTLPLMRSARAAESVRIGAMLPLSGSGAPYGPALVKASEAAVKQINAAGGVLGGRMLELFVEDDETSATAGVRAARKLIDVNKVVAVTGAWGSGPTLAVKPLCIEKGVALTALGAADETTEGDTKGLVWRFQARGSEWGEPAARAMLKDGVKRVGVLSLQNPFTSEMVTPFVKLMRDRGVQVGNVVEFKAEQASYRAEVDKVFGVKPDAVLVLAYVTQFTSIAKEVYRGGYKSRIYTLTIAADAGKNGDGKFVQNVGKEVAEGIFHVQPTSPSDRPEYRAFLQAIGAPEGIIFPFAALQYDSMQVLALAIEQAKSADARQFSRAIRAIANGPGAKVATAAEGLPLVRRGAAIDFTGAGMDVAFNERGDLQDRPFLLQVIRDGKDVVLGYV